MKCPDSLSRAERAIALAIDHANPNRFLDARRKAGERLLGEVYDHLEKRSLSCVSIRAELPTCIRINVFPWSDGHPMRLEIRNDSGERPEGFPRAQPGIKFAGQGVAGGESDRMIEGLVFQPDLRFLREHRD